MAGISSVVSGHVFCRSLLVELAFLLGGGAVEAVVIFWGCIFGVAGDFLPVVAFEVVFFLCCVVLVFNWAAFRVDLSILKTAAPLSTCNLIRMHGSSNESHDSL